MIFLSSFAAWADEPAPAEEPVAASPAAESQVPDTPVSSEAAPKPDEAVRNVFDSGLAPVQAPVGASTDRPVEIQTNLEGISISARGARAVINGEVYKEGEEKAGIKVLAIRKKEVDILINQAIKRVLSMLPGETREEPISPENTSPPALGEGEIADTSTIEGQPENKEPTYA